MSSFLLDKISQICSKITLKTFTFTSTNKKHHFITSIIRSNMNKRNSQRIYNIKQGRNVSSGMSVASQDRRRKLLQINHLFSLITSDRKQQRRAVDSTKNGWFHSHKLQQDILRKSKTPSLLLIGILLLTVSSFIFIYETNTMEISP